MFASAAAMAVSRSALASPAVPFRANVALELHCSAGAFSAGEPVLCSITLVNHLAHSHVVYVPRELFPIQLPHWPEAVLELEVRRESDGKTLPNAYLENGTVDVGAFGPSDLIALDIGRTVGWEVDLRHNYSWQFRLEPGSYVLRAHVRIGVIKKLRSVPSVRDAVKAVLSSHFKDADTLLLDGQLDSNEVRFSIEK